MHIIIIYKNLRYKGQDQEHDGRGTSAVGGYVICISAA